MRPPPADKYDNVMDLSGKRILIIKQSSLGDVIHALPLIHAMKRRYPTAFIGWVVEQGFASLLQRDGAVDTVYPIHIPSTSDPDSGKWSYFRAFHATVAILRQLRQQFRAVPYDFVLDLHASFRSGLLALTNPGGHRFGFSDAKELNTWFQHRLVENNDHQEHAIEKNLLFCGPFDCEAASCDFHLCSTHEDRAGVDRFLEEKGVGANDAVVYVNPAARWATKFWLADRWARLLDDLMASGLMPVIGGSAGDLVYINKIAAAMSHKAIIAAGQLSLTESVALMKRALVYVGLDTGPMHMAAMTGTPVVALFGPTHPERVGPYRVRNAVIQAKGLDCLCCRKRNCEHLSCMRGISVAMVYGQVMAFVEDSDPRTR